MKFGIRLVLAYDGTDFCGWQEQENQRCVQSTLAHAISRITDGPVTVKGASRTDRGVHALGQVASFATDRELSTRRWAYAINRYLPPDVAVQAAERCAVDYEPRFDARNKTYRYLLHLGALREPLWRDRAWHLGRQLRHDFPRWDDLSDAEHQLDVARMREAAQVLVGTHDFHAFRQAGDTRRDTTRTLIRVDIEERHAGVADLVAIEVQGTAFMKNMVRIIAGTLVEVGRGRMDRQAVAALLSPEAIRDDGGITAPPQGLTLLSMEMGRQGRTV